LIDPARAERELRLRALPSVGQVLGSEALRGLEGAYPRWLLVDCVRSVLERRRQKILQSTEPEALDLPSLSREVSEALQTRFAPSLRRVINATGVVLHTNLGRSLLASRAVESLQEITRHYSNLEYDLKGGLRGDRQIHLQPVLHDLTGTEASLVVNNNAAALFLIINTLAEGREAIVSRGELLEIGGSFRLPEIMKKGGAELREVGTTNKTYLSDYEEAISSRTGLLLKVHTSNFRLTGFTAACPLGELVELGRRHQIPVVEDLGSGAMVDLSRWGLPKEPLARESLREGVDLVCFSGDKLLGGSQAGLILGKEILVKRLKKNPLARAMRIDKLSLACLEATLRIYLEGERVREEIPVLSILTTRPETLVRRGQTLIELMGPMARKAFDPRIEEGEAEVGGGSLPGTVISTRCVTLRSSTISSQSMEEKLRKADPPILARIQKGTVILDMLTVRDEELEQVGIALAELARPE
jgi:L-seryl-tRNA(Ser) seleniumtransferase